MQVTSTDHECEKMTLEWVILFYIQSQIRLDYSEPSQSYGSYLNCKNIGIFSLFSKCNDSFIKCKNFFFWNEWQKCCDVMRNQISKTPTQVWLLLKVTDVKDYCTMFYDTKKVAPCYWKSRKYPIRHKRRQNKSTYSNSFVLIF